MKASSLVCVLTVPTTVLGCVHSMQVKNLDEYVASASAPRQLTIELGDDPSRSGDAAYFEFIHRALDAHPSVANVLLESDPNVPVDAVVDVTVSPDYHGSAANYFIAFPGFLVFAHAWNGFNYEAEIRTHLDIRMVDSSRELSRDVDTRYDIRHCDMGRGTATSSGWYLPGWGGTNLIVGAFMVPYDSDATPEFIRVAGPAYGSYVANIIVKAVGEEVRLAGSSEEAASTSVRFDARAGELVEHMARTLPCTDPVLSRNPAEAHAAS